MFGTVRCLENTARQFVNKRIEEIVKGVITIMGGEYEYLYNYKYPALYNNNLTDLIINACKDTFGEKKML